MIINLKNKVLQIVYCGEKLNLDSYTKEKIDTCWKNRKNDNCHLVRGQSFCIQKFVLGPEVLICLAKTDYAHYLYSINQVGPPAEPHLFCFVAALIESIDQKYVIGQMSSTTSTPFRYQLPGGGIEASDIKNDQINLSNNLRREIIEELNFDIYNTNYVSGIEPLCMITGNVSIPIIFKIHSLLSSEEIRKKYENIKVDKEFQSIIFLDKNKESIECFKQKQSFIAEYLPATLFYDLRI